MDLEPGSDRRMVVDGPVGALELLIDVPSRILGVALIGHPQPLLGGSATHKVPHFLARGLRDAGWLTLRPNFRGVGLSAGRHDEARGESDDVAWLAKAVRNTLPGLHLTLVGFSFGAYVMGRAAQLLEDTGAQASGCVLAGTPVGIVKAGRYYEPLQLGPHTLVIHGEHDADVPLQSVLDWCGSRGKAVMVVPGADHFLTGRLPLLRSLVVAHLAQVFSTHLL